MQAVQLFSPFGATRYSDGTMLSPFNFTGQRLDTQTGLLYYGARYYDATSGRFISADTVETNGSGLDPFAYVKGNPETATDPTGHAHIGPDGGENQTSITSPDGVTDVSTVTQFGTPVDYTYLPGNTEPSFVTYPQWFNDQLNKDPHPCDENCQAGEFLVSSAVIDAALLIQPELEPIALGAEAEEMNALREEEVNTLNMAGEDALTLSQEEGNASMLPCEGGLSFAYATKVSTETGKQDIGHLKPGEKVWAYNQKTKKMELEPIRHVWINHDDDLVDLTLTTKTVSPKEKTTHQSSETLHTNKKHPFLTLEKGFVPVGQLHIGMHVIEANGVISEVTAWKSVPGVQVMYNLEVTQDHTFTVGDGQWIVHNWGDTACSKLAADAKMLFQNLKPNSGSLKAIAISNSEDSQQNVIGGRNGGNSETNIGGSKAIDSPHNGKCAETHCLADIFNALQNGGKITDSDGIIRVGEYQIKGSPPCDACQGNAQLLANATNRTVYLGWSGGIAVFNPGGSPTFLSVP
ncbi:RHS repeat-associated core domain-containing protein [Dictyobacter kobayashii]|uniref:RHS repeat-associated core domain-containing protein n=1 Tax=Dictyobacter kobayashii TaxID=2014872 RepID=UPI0013876027|nr:RHS repeat-associated core domain-containing protein [Dictyobacter kobayashii]